MLAATAVTCGMLVLAGVLLIALLRDGLTRQLDFRLTNSARDLTQAFEYVDGSIQFEWEGVESGPATIFRALDSSGRVLAASSGPRQLTDDGRPSSASARKGIRRSQLSDGTMCRIATLSFIPHVEGEQGALANSNLAAIVLEVAGSTEELEAVLQLARWRLITITLIASLLTPLVLWPIMKAVMQPVQAIASHIDSLDVKSLDRQLSLKACPAELVPVVRRLDEFVDRLNDSFAREKQITANIAHELRTPLAGLSATLELAQLKPRTNEYYAQTLTSCRQIVSELTRLIERVLQLARLEAGAVSFVVESIPLPALLSEIQNELSSQYPEIAARVTSDFSQLPSMMTDRIALRQVLCNLLLNALQYGDPAQPIVITSGSKPSQQLSVHNYCKADLASDLDQLKERFFRIDDNRTQTGHNAGLGLAICDQIARHLAGTLCLSQPTPGQFVATLALPACKPFGT
jgi:signal transduction histidine kinase